MSNSHPSIAVSMANSSHMVFEQNGVKQLSPKDDKVFIPTKKQETRRLSYPIGMPIEKRTEIEKKRSHTVPTITVSGLFNTSSSPSQQFIRSISPSKDSSTSDVYSTSYDSTDVTGEDDIDTQVIMDTINKLHVQDDSEPSFQPIYDESILDHEVQYGGESDHVDPTQRGMSAANTTKFSYPNTHQMHALSAAPRTTSTSSINYPAMLHSIAHPVSTVPNTLSPYALSPYSVSPFSTPSMSPRSPRSPPPMSDGSAVSGQANPLSALFVEHPLGEHPSRTLFVRNINSNVEDEELRSLFEAYGPIRSMYTQCKHRGFVMISYYDIRHSKSAMRHLQNKMIRRRKIDIHYSIPKDNPTEKDQNQGTLVVFNLDPSITNDELKKIFSAYGEIKEIRETPNKKHHKFIEFYDVRDADKAMKFLNKTDIKGKKIKIEPSRPGGARKNIMYQWPLDQLSDEQLQQLSLHSPQSLVNAASGGPSSTHLSATANLNNGIPVNMHQMQQYYSPFHGDSVNEGPSFQESSFDDDCITAAPMYSRSPTSSSSATYHSGAFSGSGPTRRLSHGNSAYLGSFVGSHMPDLNTANGDSGSAPATPPRLQNSSGTSAFISFPQSPNQRTIVSPQQQQHYGYSYVFAAPMNHGQQYHHQQYMQHGRTSNSPHIFGGSHGMQQ